MWIKTSKTPPGNDQYVLGMEATSGSIIKAKFIKSCHFVTTDTRYPAKCVPYWTPIPPLPELTIREVAEAFAAMRIIPGGQVGVEAVAGIICSYATHMNRDKEVT